jgi:hypothetical protein
MRADVLGYPRFLGAAVPGVFLADTETQETRVEMWSSQPRSNWLTKVTTSVDNLGFERRLL